MNLLKQIFSTIGIIILLCLSFNAEAQFKKIKLGNIPEEFKSYTDCDFSPGSGAVVLKNEGESYAEIGQSGINTYYRYHKYIKILNKDGLEEGDIEFIEYGNIFTLKAATYNEEDGKWVASNFDKSNLYKEKIKGRRGVMDYKIPMPNVSVGSIIEILIEVKYDGLFIPDWYFQDDIPVLHSSYTTSHLNDFIYRKEIKSYYPVEKMPVKNVSMFLGTNKFNGSEWTYIAKNVPPIETNEKFAPDPYEYASHIEFNLSEVRSSNFQNQNFLPKNYLQYSKALLKSSDFGGHLEKSKKGILSKLGITIEAEEDVLTRAKKIYETIQDKIEWDEYYSKIPDKSPSKTIKDGTGEVADINMLLVAALREAGLKAYPLMASTRENGTPNPLSPSKGDLDYLLCVLKVDEKDIILDASMDGLPFGMIPEDVLNNNGYVVDLVRYGWIPIQNVAVYEEIYVVNLKIEDDQLKGKVMTKLGDYAAYNFYISEDDKEVDEFKDEFKKSIAADWEWDEIDFKEIVSSKPVIAKGEISKEFELEDLIYIEPVVFKIFNENPFKDEKRVSPVDIPYQIKYKLIFSLEIPEGYTAEEIPSSNKVLIPEDGGSLTYIADAKNNKVSINITFEQKTLNYSVSQYDIIHSFYALLHEQLENMIVLKKM